MCLEAPLYLSHFFSHTRSKSLRTGSHAWLVTTGTAPPGDQGKIPLIAGEAGRTLLDMRVQCPSEGQRARCLMCVPHTPGESDQPFPHTTVLSQRFFTSTTASLLLLHVPQYMQDLPFAFSTRVPTAVGLVRGGEVHIQTAGTEHPGSHSRAPHSHC